MPVRSQEAKRWIYFLNSCLELDNDFLTQLVNSRVACNRDIAEHPAIQVNQETDNEYTVGFLGLLNGFLGTFDVGSHAGWGPITAIIDDCGKIERFELTNNSEL